jgi:hypothetical protein
LLQDIFWDAQSHRGMPYMIVGDLNGHPEDFEVLKEMMGENAIHDVGAVEHKAGQPC